MADFTLVQVLGRNKPSVSNCPSQIQHQLSYQGDRSAQPDFSFVCDEDILESHTARHLHVPLSYNLSAIIEDLFPIQTIHVATSRRAIMADDH